MTWFECLLVGVVDPRLRLRVGECPGDADRLRGAERQVEPGHRLRPP